MNEDQLEQHCLDWFREGGWETLYGPDIAPDSNNPEANSRTWACDGCRHEANQNCAPK